jgi:hypothetical protein
MATEVSTLKWVKDLISTEPDWNTKGNTFINNKADSKLMKPWISLHDTQVEWWERGKIGKLQALAIAPLSISVGAVTGAVYMLIEAVKVIVVVGIYLGKAFLFDEPVASLIKILPSIVYGSCDILKALAVLLVLTLDPLCPGWISE